MRAFLIYHAKVVSLRRILWACPSKSRQLTTLLTSNNTIMRKLFLLIPLLAFALLANADVINVAPGNNTIRYAIASSSTKDGDVLVLAGGTYTDDNYIEFNKSVEVRAAVGETPIVQLFTYIKVAEGKDVTIKDVVFDGNGQGSYSYTIRQYNVHSLTLEGCEFRNMKNIVIYGPADSHTGSLTVNNCYFHNNQKQAIFFEASTTEGTETCDELTVTNSTFANTTALTDWRSIIEARPFSTASSTTSDAIKVVIDHCTFYNNPCVDSGHANIRTANLSDVTVSNCIFVHPTEIAQRATYCTGGGNINNCLTYNYTAEGTKGHAYGATVNAASVVADPLFNDLANNKYTFDGNWVTMSLSPARGAATDGSDLGDPRWYSNEVLPSTDFVAPYQFVGTKAKLSGNIWYDDVNEYLYYNNKSTNGTAMWKIHAERACVVGVAPNLHAGSPTVHKLKVNILDADGNSVGELSEQTSTLPGSISIPAEGDYTIILNDDQAWTSAQVDNITLAYVGGAIVTVPAEELVGTEAVLVNEGHLKVSKLANGDLKYGDNGNPLDEYVYWNINATKRGNMKVTLNVVAPTEGSASTHDFLVELYSDLSGSPIASSAEAAETSGTGARVLPDAINIPSAGNYFVKLTNQKQWSSAILHSIEFEYLGGETITVPAEALIGEEAVIVDAGHLKVSKLANGDLKYGDNGHPLDEYVYWNINATKYGRMNVTANVVAPTEGSASGHQFLVELYSDLSGSPIASSAEAEATSATGAITMPALNIPATGNYIIKLTNQKQWSSAILHSIEFAYAGGEVADVPGQIVAADAMLLKEDGGTLKMYINDDGDLQYGNNGYNLTEYAVWNINATEACEMIVTLNIAHNGHLFTVELYDGTTLLGSAVEADATKWDEGDIDLDDHLTIPTAGSYTIKLINRQQYSGGAIHGITFTKYIPATVVTMNDTDAGTDAWSAYVGGAAVNVTVNRTILGGMYNAICLPFALTNSQVKATFGNDVELYYLNGATLENEVLDMQFAVANDIYQGTPYLIKTSSNVVNPTFNGVSIILDEASTTFHTGWPVSFVGTFVQTTIDADGQNMLIYSNNQVGFPDANKTLKGFRAYFHLSSPSLAPSIKTARIITPNNTPTVINLVNGQQSSAQSQKLLIDGRLIIVRDGVQYNVIGARVK